MMEIPKGEGSKYPTLMKNFETDEDLDDYVIHHAYMFVVIQIRPGGYVNGHGSNYTRTEVQVSDFGGDTQAALQHATAIGESIYEKSKKSLLIYAVANFAGALGFNRPVRSVPEKTFRSKADQRRDEARARKLRQIERERSRELKGKTKALKTPKREPKAAVFNTDFDDPAPFVKKAAQRTMERLVDEEFYATDEPMARLIRD